MTMTLACAIDRNYTELAGVMLHSVRINGDIPHVPLCVLGDGLKPIDKKRLEICAGRKIKFIDLTDEMIARFAGFRTNANWSRAIYGRLILPDLLDADVTRLVYLDADTMAKKSIRPLFEMDLGGAIAAAVGGPLPRMNASIGRPADRFYFNSGVLVLELEKYRTEKLGDRALEIVRNNNLRFPDQDALNLVIDGRVMPLDRSWNEELAAGSDTAAIIHFTHAKPNTTRCKHPEKELFLEYRRDTPWANKRLKTKLDKRWRKFKHSLHRRWKAVAGG